MPLLDYRELLQFPEGNNSTDTVINDVHFNLTALKEFGYTIYSNNTISNNSKCYLIFDQFQPHMFSNGSWVNATSCYTPYYHIQGRGIASIICGTFFAVSIVFTLINLRKHGRLYVREDKRFRVIGRRWQWYWMLFVAACGMISTFTGVDVDRYYLQQLPIVLQSFFFMLMVPGVLATVWEATRHWGSWQARQLVDPDPFSLPQDDRRAKIEFYLPLVFYLFAWLNFFMVIPRSWTAIEKQNSPEQKQDIARPSATDSREKIGAIFAALAWAVIFYSLHHSLKHYKPSASSFWRKVRATPFKLSINLTLLAARVGYGIASTWIWDLSIFQKGVAVEWPFGLGYGPIIAILFVFQIAGFQDENEDKIIIRQRRERGAVDDATLGLVKKPHWWNRNWADRYKTDEQRLQSTTTEVGGGRATTSRIMQSIEMGNMNFRSMSRSREENPFRDPNSSDRIQPISGPTTGLMPSKADSDESRTMADASIPAGLTGQSPAERRDRPQQQIIRSMLDV